MRSLIDGHAGRVAEASAVSGQARHSRRDTLALLLSSCAIGLRPAAAQSAPAAGARQNGFGYEDVVRQARQLGERPFDADGAAIPAELTKLSYDSYREIRFRRDKAFWREGESDFRLLPFHLGFLHNKPVQIHIVSDGTAIPIPFTTGLFEYGKVPVTKGLSPSLGFAGFAVTTNLNDPTVQDEVISFLGASYFRLIGRGHRYGLSARSLALDVGGEQPEEFPFMRALWVEEPSRDTAELVIYALLDSPSVAGAYRYVVRPGQETHVDVTATIVPRKSIARLGIAPLTSMFQAGEGDLAQRTDFRPEIHDSDGLMMQTGAGEWIWRPLRNPKALRISSFGDRNPRGFGLMQRDRDFGNYQDLEAHYHARPGYWVEPQGEWGEGRVDLIEIPTVNEAFDNIVACWTPREPLPIGKPAAFSYRISALSTTGDLHPYAQTRHSFNGSDIEDVHADGFGKKRFIVDFGGGDLAYYLSDPSRVEIAASTTAGTVAATILDANPAAKGFRAIVDVTLPDGQAAELRIYLRSRGRPLSETWTSTWSVPAAPAVAPAKAVDN
ncbi:glucan biosynthesis protein G [Bosea sp. 124]|uniref:glucan biosynthesis protein n=1 Tax=Bosea sp. 124 TaxID=2135642 RepID=UPI000D3BBD7C|nr:glucan biosynthesis protein G [Bosea sp. 124]PTM41346.1 glucans biosynthesis protein [Bosea sp. 124]